MCSLVLAQAQCALAADRGGAFVSAYKDEPATLNPLMESSSVGSLLCQIVFDGLVTISPSGKISPRIAKSWTVSKDMLTWTFRLRDDVVFHDGSPLTSEDVVFTYGALKDNPLGYSVKGFFDNVKTITPAGDNAVRFQLKEPGSAFLINLYAIGVLPKHILNKNPYTNSKFNRKPVGTGPFRVESWNRGKSITLKANERYFRGRPHIDRIRLDKVENVLDMWTLLQLNKIDAIYNDVLPNQFKSLEASKSLTSYKIPDYMNFVLAFNFRHPLLKDQKMRYAVNAAIDRRKIIQAALSGNAMECSGMFRPGDAGISSKNVYDPKKSMKLLSGMGYKDSDGDGILDRKGQALSFTILYDSQNILKKQVILEIRRQLAQTGIEIKGREVPIRDIISAARAGDFDMIFLNYNSMLDMPILIWHTKGINAGFNYSHYSNPRADELMDRLMRTSSGKTKDSIKKKIHAVMSKDVAGAFLFQKYNLVAVNKRIKGFRANADMFFWEFATQIHIPKSLQK